MMNRRRLLAGAAAGAGAALLPSCAPLSPGILLEDGYSMWYNRPGALALGGGRYLISSVSSTGTARLSQVGEGAVQSLTVGRFKRISDHATPAIIRAGDRGIYAIANHSSPLYVGSIALDAMDGSQQLATAPLDEGLCTYPSLVWHAGELLLFYTTLYFDSRRVTYRDYVMRRSADGGETWSEKTVCIPAIERILPYPVQPFATADGRLWIVFSKAFWGDTSQAPLKHLFLLYSTDGGRSWTDEHDGNPAWSEGPDTYLRVYDARPVRDSIRTVSVTSPIKRHEDRLVWDQGRAIMVDFDLARGVVSREITDVSRQLYPGGSIVRSDKLDRLLVSEMRDGKEVIGEWSVVDGSAKRLRILSSPGGLVFPFQADDGAVFAHTNYRASRTREFYADIVLTDL